MDGDENLLKEVWEIFAVDGPRQWEDFNTAFQARDFAQMERLAHSLSAAAANIGANMLNDAARQLELAAQKQDLNELRLQHQHTRGEFHKVMESLAHLGCEAAAHRS
jgi:HPt (histidine-containing phosphotransfer) domain-containing protein